MNPRLLFDEYPLIVSPKLATILGLAPAVFLQQIHYWVSKKMEDPSKYQDGFVKGQWWVWDTFEGWAEKYPFIGSTKTIQRLVKDLQDKAILVVEKGPDPMIRTNYYRINYLQLERYISDHMHEVNLTRSIRTKSPDGLGQKVQITENSDNEPKPSSNAGLAGTENQAPDLDKMSECYKETETTEDIEFRSEDLSDLFHKSSSHTDDEIKSLMSLEEKKPEPVRRAKPRSDSPLPKFDPAGFEDFYHAYPVRKGRADACIAWDTLRPDETLKARMMKNIEERKIHDDDWLRGYAPWPQKYLKKSRWTDDFKAANEQSTALAKVQTKQSSYQTRQQVDCDYLIDELAKEVRANG